MSATTDPADPPARGGPTDDTTPPHVGPGAGGVGVEAPPTFGDAPVAAADGPRPPWWRRAVRGRPEDPAWVRPGLLVLLVGTAVMYLWDLGASGYANEFYAAAVQSGTKSWEAFFFGSSDWGNVITVDKPPASLWVMALSGRIFGFSSWSMLVPQALEGVASVGLLYLTVRRWAGAGAGLAAGAIFALTPVAVLMFRFNNPDALLVLLMIAAAYCVVRAMDTAATRAGTWWLALAGAALGIGFLTKMLQAFLVLPGFALVFLLFAPVGLWRRISQLLLAGAALVVAAGWWVLATVLWPADSRPYIGGSTNNSVLELAFGYNGLGRIFADSGGGPGGGSGNVRMGGGFGAGTGLGRMFDAEIGTQVAWLIPAALIALAAGLWLTRRAPRTDRARAGLVLWGSWMLVTAGVFSYMEGIFHPYYTIALAPGIAATVAIGARELWHARASVFSRVMLAVVVVASGTMAWDLLGRADDWHPWLRWVVAATSLIAAVLLLTGPVECVRQLLRRAAVVGAVTGVAGLVAALLGPAAYAADTATTPHGGSIPSAGPASAGGSGPANGMLVLQTPQGTFTYAVPRGGAAPGGQGNRPGGQGSGQGNPQNGDANSALTELLAATTTDWAAAIAGSGQASSLQLNSGKAVIPIGGFSGGDPAPTLAQFKKWVAAGRIHYYIGDGGGGPQFNGNGPSAQGGQTAPGGRTPQGQNPQNPQGQGEQTPVGPQQARGGPGGGRGTAAAISEWVAANFTKLTVGNQTVYDLTRPTN